jgi:hypothetical protein
MTGHSHESIRSSETGLKGSLKIKIAIAVSSSIGGVTGMWTQVHVLLLTNQAAKSAYYHKFAVHYLSF